MKRSTILSRVPNENTNTNTYVRTYEFSDFQIFEFSDFRIFRFLDFSIFGISVSPFLKKCKISEGRLPPEDLSVWLENL